MATTTPIQSLPVPETVDDPDVVGDINALANAIEKRLAAVYNSIADRDARLPAPQEGQVAILKDTNQVLVYLDSAWKQIYPAETRKITVSTLAPTGGANGDIHYRV